MVQTIFNILFALAALVAILDYFGIKPTKQAGRRMPLSRRWKLLVMLALTATSLVLSGYSFYRSLHPKIVEKVIEKPIERIVQKECPSLPSDSKRDRPRKTETKNGSEQESVTHPA